jgi:hypothetical protein
MEEKNPKMTKGRGELKKKIRLARTPDVKTLRRTSPSLDHINPLHIAEQLVPMLKK